MIYPTIGTITYLSYPKSIRIPSNILIPLSIAHNLCLALFSAYTCASLISLLLKDGIHYEAHYYLKQEPQTDRDHKYISLLFYFYLSKYYEYIDTFLLYLKNKEPIFLQKFHHIGAVICWHICYIYKVDAILVGTVLNSGVHTVMYTYYLLTLFNIRLNLIKPLITKMQLAQLVVGNLICAYNYVPPIESYINYGCILFTNAYVFVLIYLFSDFYKKNYLKPQHNKDVKTNTIQNLQTIQTIQTLETLETLETIKIE